MIVNKEAVVNTDINLERSAAMTKEQLIVLIKALKTLQDTGRGNTVQADMLRDLIVGN